MKKTFILPLLGAAVFVSQAWATQCQESGKSLWCEWPNGCFKIDPEYDDDGKPSGKQCAEIVANCRSYGVLYTNVTGTDDDPYGRGMKCADGNGTWLGGKDPNAVALGCCKWDKPPDHPDYNKCWTIWQGEYPADGIDGEVKMSDCQNGAHSLWSGACPNSDGGCPSGTPNLYDGASKTAMGCCKWDNQSVCYTIYDNQQEVTDCKSGDNKFWNIGKCPNEGGTCPTSNPDNGGDVQPIIKLSMSATSNIVKAIHNGINVQLMDKAKIQVYDLKGNLARSLELAQGSYNVELSNMPRGTYIVKVTSRSWKQTVTVPVK